MKMPFVQLMHRARVAEKAIKFGVVLIITLNYLFPWTYSIETIIGTAVVGILSIIYIYFFMPNGRLVVKIKDNGVKVSMGNREQLYKWKDLTSIMEDNENKVISLNFKNPNTGQEIGFPILDTITFYNTIKRQIKKQADKHSIANNL